MSILTTDCWIEVLLRCDYGYSFFASFFSICKATSQCSCEQVWNILFAPYKSYFSGVCESATIYYHKFRLVWNAFNRSKEAISKECKVEFGKDLDIALILKNDGLDNNLYKSVTEYGRNNTKSQFLTICKDESTEYAKFRYMCIGKQHSFTYVFYLVNESAINFLAKLFILCPHKRGKMGEKYSITLKEARELATINRINGRSKTEKRELLKILEWRGII